MESNPVACSGAEPRPGLCQVLEMQDVTGDAARPSDHLLGSHVVDSAVASHQESLRVPLGLGMRLPPLPSINAVSVRFAESASNFGRRLANLVEETIARDVRTSLIDPIAGPPIDRVLSSDSTEHRATIDGPLTSAAPSSTVSALTISLPARDASGSAIESNGLLSNLAIERATSILSSTGAAVRGIGQQFMTTPPAVWHGLVTRVQTTLRGSADDIGWLQRMGPPVEDGTDLFLQTLDTISHGVHVLPNTLTYLLIPGLFSNHAPLYFVDTKKHFSKLGLSCHIAKIHSESAVEKNAKELKEHIEELYWGTGKNVVLLGHSKGGVDAAAACSMFWQDLKDKVVGLVLVQSPYGGSPIASDILREGQIADVETRRIIELLICRIIEGDMQSLEDLTYDRRRQFLAKYTLPPDLPTISFHTEASRAPGWVSTMSHVALAELPWLSGSSTTAGPSVENGAGTRVPVAIPLAAAMAVCALHLELRYGEKSDGLVTRKDAEVPGSIVVRPEKKLDHAWMVYSPSRKNPLEPDAPQMCEALITLLLNHEKWRRDETHMTCEAEVSLHEAQASASAALSKSDVSLVHMNSPSFVQKTWMESDVMPEAEVSFHEAQPSASVSPSEPKQTNLDMGRITDMHMMGLAGNLSHVIPEAGVSLHEAQAKVASSKSTETEFIVGNTMD